MAEGQGRRDITAREAVTAAWAWWAALIATPGLAAALGAWAIGVPAGAAENLAGVAFAAGVGLWLLVAVPAAFVLRSHCFRATWRGRGIEPARYLRGVVTVWGALEVGALGSVAGCLVSGGWLPCAALGALAVAALVVLAPTARAVAG